MREANASESRTELLTQALARSAYAAVLDDHQVEVTQDGIRVGAIEVLPGEKRDRPVFRDAEKKTVLSGSGRFPKANDPALVGKLTAHRQSATYRQALEALVPLFGTDDAKHSFEQLLDVLWRGIEGTPTPVACSHEGCTSRRHMYYPKPDPSSGFKLVELLAGKAAQTVNINAREHKLIETLEQRTVDVHVHGIDDADADRREALIKEFGYTVEGEFVTPPVATGDPQAGGTAE